MEAAERLGQRSRREKVGWWLLPAEPDARVLARTIDALAARLGVPAFPPHVTLASGAPETLDAVLARAGAEHALELDVARVETTGTLARTLALRFADEERVDELARRLNPTAFIASIASTASMASMEGRPPAHLSLVYAPLAAAERAELARATPAPLTRIRFDSIAAVRMFAGELVLEDVPRWRELARVPLSG